MSGDDASHRFAVRYNELAWELLARTERGEEETARMIHAAHASHMHWLDCGGPANWQRGAWLVARVLAEAGDGAGALRHAAECRRLTDAHGGEMADFDLAYALEAEARAHAVAGDLDRARSLRAAARAAAGGIAGEGDRKLVLADIEGGNWAGLGVDA